MLITVTQSQQNTDSKVDVTKQGASTTPHSHTSTALDMQGGGFSQKNEYGPPTPPQQLEVPWYSDCFIVLLYWVAVLGSSGFVHWASEGFVWKNGCPEASS